MSTAASPQLNIATVQNPKGIEFTLTYDKEKDQIFTFVRLMQENFWYFGMGND